jgi:hypothetical protein
MDSAVLATENLPLKLTCHHAYDFAVADMPKKFRNSEVQFITQFTSIRFTEDNSSWSAILLNYYMCLAILKINPAIGISVMDDAGIGRHAIEFALNKAGYKKNRDDGYEIQDTQEPIAPPTFRNDPKLWDNRGYAVDHDLIPGDICLFDGLVGFYHKQGEQGIYVVAGFSDNSIGLAVADQRLIKVIRV